MSRIQDNDALATARFFNHPVKNESASVKAGRPIYDDVEHVRITLAANKQTVGVFPAHEVFTRQDDPVTGERVPVTYAMRYNKEYLAFKTGEDQAASGTPLEMLPFLTAAKRLELKALNIHTAEALASLGGNNLKMLGMGGRQLQEQATAYIEDSAGQSTETALVDRISEQDREIADLRARLAAFDGDGDGKPGGSAAAPKSDDEDDDTDDEQIAKSPFAEYENADIINWIRDTSPETQVDGRWGRKRLIAKADEINAELAKKKAEGQVA